jgi:methylated-DNA-[protein]-cysteine S-methyltransferase
VIVELRTVAVPTPIGQLTVVVSNGGVVATMFDDGDAERHLERIELAVGAPARPASHELAGVRREVEAYFRGRRGAFETPVDLELVTDGFPRRVLEATMRIHYGELATYGDVAAAAGSPRGARPAGNALSRCPIELWVPCHRVVHASGRIGGYGRHEDRKRFLLRLEDAL